MNMIYAISFTAKTILPAKSKDYKAVVTWAG